MRQISISDEVWNVIAAHGEFPETPNDVLERLLLTKKEAPKPFSSPENKEKQFRQSSHNDTRQPFSTRPLSAYVQGKIFHVKFDHGPENRWQLPDVSDKPGIRKVRDMAVAFAKEHGASYGQERAVMKALTNAGYWLVK
jgi:hypothetical protein